jgi:hypothetical protein
MMSPAELNVFMVGADSVVHVLARKRTESINGSPFQIISTFDTASISSLAISTINGAAFPQNISTIDTGSFSSLTVSTINGEPFPQNISTIDNGSISSLSVSSINGATFPQSLPDVSLWANYPALSSVVVNNQNILADKGTNVTEQSAVNILAQNGRNGEITLNAKAGYLGASGGVVNVIADGGQTGIGLYGAVNITANPGLTGAIGSGGLVNITAVSATAFSNLTSAVKISAGGVNSYAGVIPSFGSVFGYNFTYGSLGVSLCAGLPPSGFQIPGTTYIYGTTGIALNSDVYATRFYPYWDGLTAPADISINGRTTISGSASVKLSNVTNMFMDSGAISGVNTINGSSYPPLIPEGVIGISTNFGTVSSIVEFVAGNQLGITTDLPNNTLTFSIPTNFTASTILTNPLGFVSSGLVIADGIVASSISVSTINGEPYLPFSGSLSTIKNGTAFANIDASGLIFIDNSDAVSGFQYINMDYTGVSIRAQGNLLLEGDTTSKILIDGSIDDLTITGGGGQSINLGFAGSIIISTATCGLNIYGATPLVTVSSDFLPTLSSFNLGSASIPWNNLNVSTVNGQDATAFAASWANFPAGATIDAGGYSITNVTTITTGAVVQPCIQYGTATTSVSGTVTITLTTEYASAAYSAIITPLDSAFPTLVPSVANRTTTSFDIKGDASTDYQWVTFGSVY